MIWWKDCDDSGSVNNDTNYLLIITMGLLIHVQGHSWHTQMIFRLQLYSSLKSDWSGTWLLLPIDATYRGFYCVRGLRRVGTMVGWSQVEGRSHLTARVHTSHLSTFCQRSSCWVDSESSKSSWFLSSKRSSDSILNRMLLKTEALAYYTLG